MNISHPMIIESIYLLDITGYSGELEKLRRDDTDLILEINLKNALTKKLRLRLWESIKANICTYYQIED